MTAKEIRKTVIGIRVADDMLIKIKIRALKQKKTVSRYLYDLIDREINRSR